ncbi:hypothetical protein HHI36_021639 [Cryptolaemus montrouzieri]|uniref:Mannosyltransferase n=1 Tax=Cryptolaemus montrouzieri TaxID=559131 RepID=A0ABD2MXT3_9CUCU
MSLSTKMYRYFAATRIFLVFLPWMGYIHPDEFFQSVEVIGGKFLNVESTTTWEFNCTSPIRSIALTYFTLGMSYKILLGIDYILKTLLATTIFTSYYAILAPRIFMCASSFIVDYSLYKICCNNNEKSRSRLIILSSSYVILTYATKTFSNSLELFLFSLLLYFVSESLTFSNQILRKKEYVQYRYSKSKTIPEKAKFHKLNLYLKTDSLRNCWQISTIVVVGVFNRPTFLAYATIPVFFWLYRGIGSKVISNIHFHFRISALIVCSIPSFMFIVLVDSFYYGYITWGEIGVLDISINSFVFTPLNFIKYNMNSKNLGHHGLHPRYLHALVSMPLLFSLLTFFHYYTLGNYFHRLTQSKFNLLPSVRSIKGLMTLSSVIPLALLSIFPHQEPRFILPLLLPLVYLYGTKILPEKEQGVIKADPNSFKATTVNETSNFFYITWFFINVILMVFFGFLHQGGVVPALSHISKIAKRYDNSVELHIFSSHTYMLPKFLLLQRQRETKTDGFINDIDYSNKRIHIYDVGTNDLEFLARKIDVVYSSLRNTRGKRFKMFLLIPVNSKYDFLKKIRLTHLSIDEVNVFYPHVSTEALSNVGEFYFDLIQMLNYEIIYDMMSITKFLKID